jgi:hypothetical protein
MIRSRLLRLERLVTEAIANCPGCVLIPARIWMPGEPAPSTEPVRCARCGKAHQPTVIRIITPGFPGPLMAKG